jgi:hypothetical protein
VRNSNHKSRLLRLVSLLCISILSLITITSCASHNGDLKCGKEYRISTKDSVTYQGNLRMSNGTMLILDTPKGGMLELRDADQAFRVERHTLEGVLAGSLIGAGIGLYAAVEWFGPYKSLLYTDPTEAVAGSILGAVVGGVIGGLLGHIPAYKEVEIDMLPICEPESVDMMRIGISYEF